MLGKASELKSESIDVRELNGWLANSPNVTVIDIKVSIIWTDHAGLLNLALIIYREDKPQ